MKKIIEIPIQSQAACDYYNEILKSNCLSTEQHIENLFEKIRDMLEQVGDEGGWYFGDSIKVEINIEYLPEEK